MQAASASSRGDGGGVSIEFGSPTFQVHSVRGGTRSSTGSPASAAFAGGGDRTAFCSLRYDAHHGVVPMAQELQAAMAARGTALQITDMAAGGDIDTKIFESIERMDTFIVFGSAHYGEDTGNQSCTFYEYKHAFALKKNIVLIRMIPFDQEFEELQARVIFNANKLVIPWMLGTPMPTDLPDQILQAMGAAPPADDKLAGDISTIVDQRVDDRFRIRELEVENAQLKSQLAQALQQVDTLRAKNAELELLRAPSREEMVAMKPRQLKAAAIELGISQDRIDEAFDADDMKGFLIDLIAEQSGQSTEEGQATSGPQVEALETRVAELTAQVATQAGVVAQLEHELAAARPPVPDPTPFNQHTEALGLDDADRQILRDNDICDLDDLAVMGSDDYHAIGIHIEEKRHALALRQALQAVRMSDKDIGLIFTQAQSRACATHFACFSTPSVAPEQS
jgi:hypothetical protein